MVFAAEHRSAFACHPTIYFLCLITERVEWDSENAAASGEIFQDIDAFDPPFYGLGSTFTTKHITHGHAGTIVVYFAHSMIFPQCNFRFSNGSTGS